MPIPEELVNELEETASRMLSDARILQRLVLKCEEQQHSEYAEEVREVALTANKAVRKAQKILKTKY